MCTYESLNPLLPASQRLLWLQKATDSYHPQPYEQLADHYRTIGHDDEARTVSAEASHFPVLTEPTGTNRSVQHALADRLAELGEQGLLDVPDPMEAAEFLGLLVTGRVNNRSWFGAVQLDDTEIARLVAGGIRIFLRAFRPVTAKP